MVTRARATRTLTMLAVFSLVASACSGDESEPARPSDPEAAPAGAPAAVADVMPNGYGTQDFQILLDMAEVVGDEGAESFYQQVIDQAQADLGDPVSMADGVRFSPTSGLEGQVLDATADPLRSIALDFGVFDLEDPATALEGLDLEPDLSVTPDDLVGAGLVVMFSTASLDEAYVNVGQDDLFDIDLTFVDALTPGDTLEYKYVFGQTLAPTDPSIEQGLSPAEVFVQRWESGRVHFLGTDGESETEVGVVVDSEVETVEGSTRGRSKAKVALGIGGLGLPSVGIQIPVGDRKVCLPGGSFCVILRGVLPKDMKFGSRPLLAAMNPPQDPDGGSCVAPPQPLPGPDDGGGSGGGDDGDRPPEPEPLPGPDDGGGDDGGDDGGGGPGPQPLPGFIDVRGIANLVTSLLGPDDGDPGGAPDDGGSGAGGSGAGGGDGGGSGGLGSGCGGGAGEPHLVTYDGLWYDFQSAGEFVAAESDDGHTLQWRLEPYAPDVLDRGISTVTAVAMNVDDTTVSVQLDDGDTTLYLDDEATDLGRGGILAVDSGGGIVNTGSAYVVVWADGSTAWVNTAHRSWLDAFFRPAPDSSGWRGLLGDLDGDPSNDLETREGESLPTEPEFDQLYGPFADSWRITQQESLFHYAEGENTQTFTIEGFPAEPVTVDGLDPDARADAEQACQAAGITDPAAFTNCVLDVGLTGDPLFALSALLTQIAAGTELPGEVVWASELTGYNLSGATSPNHAVLDTRGRLLVRAENEADEIDLLALDAGTGEIEATWEDLAASCVPGLDGDGRIWAQRRIETGGAEMIAIDTETDEVVGSYLPATNEAGITACDGVIHPVFANQVVLLHDAQFTTTVEAFEFADGAITSLWRTPLEGVSSPQLAVSQDGAGIYLLQLRTVDAGEAVVLSKLEPADGAVVDELEIAVVEEPGIAHFSDVVSDTDGSVYVSYPEVDGERSYTVVAEVIDDGETLTEGWRADDEQISHDWDWALHVSGGLLVSWDGSGTRIVAIDTDTGDFVWEYEAESFKSVPSIPADSEGNLYVAPFVGFVESIDPSGERRWYLSAEDTDLGAALSLGPVDAASRLYVMYTNDDTPVWAALDSAP